MSPLHNPLQNYKCMSGFQATEQLLVGLAEVAEVVEMGLAVALVMEGMEKEVGEVD